MIEGLLAILFYIVGVCASLKIKSFLEIPIKDSRLPNLKLHVLVLVILFLFFWNHLFSNNKNLVLFSVFLLWGPYPQSSYQKFENVFKSIRRGLIQLDLWSLYWLSH
ncbi:MAG: hypothetical protein A2787_03270 [Omnitrophica WOR_2 bacterium RIFCSPHIGHO2_01_FULL_48_9]|nr:MAG: hypothetical protein A2787_03270 [Omnitrophica WOR_2 bacterium RIFCSPHIGHO2_01_FULL_48_9]